MKLNPVDPNTYRHLVCGAQCLPASMSPNMLMNMPSDNMKRSANRVRGPPGR